MCVKVSGDWIVPFSSLATFEMRLANFQICLNHITEASGASNVNSKRMLKHFSSHIPNLIQVRG
jgi:hypothetical protein